MIYVDMQLQFVFEHDASERRSLEKALNANYGRN